LSAVTRQTGLFSNARRSDGGFQGAVVGEYQLTPRLAILKTIMSSSARARVATSTEPSPPSGDQPKNLSIKSMAPDQKRRCHAAATAPKSNRTSNVKRFFYRPLRQSTSKKNGDQTLQRHPESQAGASRQKPAFAQPANDNGRRVAIPEGCEISQNSQIAPMQTALHPRAH